MVGNLRELLQEGNEVWSEENEWMDVLGALDIWEKGWSNETMAKFSKKLYGSLLQHICYGYESGDFFDYQCWWPLMEDVCQLIDDRLDRYANPNAQQDLEDRVAALEKRLESNRAYSPPNANYSGKRKNSRSDA